MVLRQKNKNKNDINRWFYIYKVIFKYIEKCYCNITNEYVLIEELKKPSYFYERVITNQINEYDCVRENLLNFSTYLGILYKHKMMKKKEKLKISILKLSKRN